MKTQTCFPSEPFTRGDLDALGIAPAVLKKALAEGEVRRLLRGVFVAGTTPDSLELRVQAVSRVVTPGHVVCDRTAAWLHGVDVLGLFDETAIPPVEICALRWRPATARIDVRGRNRDLAERDVESLGGLLVTTPLRTSLDLGCVLWRADALAGLDQFRRLFGFERAELARAAVRYFRRRGVVQLRELIPLSDPRSESPRESWTRLALHDAGLPAPEPQHEIVVDGVVIWRLDLAYPRQRIAIEYDGREFHHTPGQLLHDERRRDWLREHGWTVFVVRRGDFSEPRLTRWLSDVRRALDASYSNLRW